MVRPNVDHGEIRRLYGFCKANALIGGPVVVSAGTPILIWGWLLPILSLYAWPRLNDHRSGNSWNQDLEIVL
jgi:hypothetical protein